MLARKTTASLTTIVGRRVRITPLSRALYRSRFLIHIKKESFPFWGKLGKRSGNLFSLFFSLSRLARIAETREMTSLETLTLERKKERERARSRETRARPFSLTVF